MFPHNRRTRRKSLTRFSIALFAVTAQFICTSHSFAAPGDLYVTDLATGSVVVYAPDGSATTFATDLTSPQGIVFDAGVGFPSSIYVADAGDGGANHGVVYRYDVFGNRTTLATSLSNPIGLAIDGANVLVSENGAGRVTRLPINGSARTISLLVSNPLGLDASGSGGSGFLTKYVATGDSVLKVVPGNPAVDIDSDDISRSVGVDPVVGNAFVTTEAGTITEIPADGSPKFTFASGLTDPHGMGFVPPGLNVNKPGVYVADTSAGTIYRVPIGGTPLPFVTGAGNPNYLAFETVAPDATTPTPTPTPTPTVSPTPTPTVSPTPTPTVSPTPTPTPTPPSKALNLSTRVDVQTGTNVGIGGFIITGTPKLVVIRAKGPSLTDFGVAGALPDPVLELHDSTQAVIATSDDWMNNSDADQTMLIDHGLAPTNDLESAIIKTLDPGLYTAVVSGNNGGTGVALIELFDLDDPGVAGELGNISTRGFVGTDANVMIGGLIIGPEGGLDAAVVVRALGPSLANFGIPDPLADPVPRTPQR